MYDILRNAVKDMKDQGLPCIECDCPTHGRFKVYTK